MITNVKKKGRERHLPDSHLVDIIVAEIAWRKDEI